MLSLSFSFLPSPFWWTALAFSLDRRFLQRFTEWGQDGSSRSTAKVFPSSPPTRVATKNTANGTSAFSSQRREVTLGLDLIPPCLRGEFVRSGVANHELGVVGKIIYFDWVQLLLICCSISLHLFRLHPAHCFGQKRCCRTYGIIIIECCTEPSSGRSSLGELNRHYI